MKNHDERGLFPDEWEADFEFEEVDEQKIEADLSQVKEADRLVRLYLNEIAVYPLLSRDHQVSLARKYMEKGDFAARDMLINHNLRLVVWVAKRYRGHREQFSDLVQEGTIGLMKAVEKFKPELGNALATYAVWWIRQSINRYLRNEFPAFRLPVQVLEKLQNMHLWKEELARQGVLTPTELQLASAMGISVPEVRKLYRSELCLQPVYLDGVTPRKKSISDDDGFANLSAIDNLLTPNPSLLARASDEFLLVRGEISQIRKKIAQFGVRNEQLFLERFGLMVIEDGKQTLENIGQQHNVTRERARQIVGHILLRIGRTQEEMFELGRKFQLVGEVVASENETSAPESSESNQSEASEIEVEDVFGYHFEDLEEE
jgi:RNA polymerase primary sigma factor